MLSPLMCARGREACKAAVTKPREGRKINSNPKKRAVGMGLDISPQTEAPIRQEAQRQGIWVDALPDTLSSLFMKRVPLCPEGFPNNRSSFD